MSAIPPNSAELPSSLASGSRPLSLTSSIIVVGGSGTIGSSTALHLARRGYTNVRVLDLYPAPSKISAGNDLNKVAGSGREGIWGEMGRASAKAWKEDPLFSQHYHQTGTIMAADTSLEMIASLKERYEVLLADGLPVEWLDTKADIVRHAPHLADADLEGWKGLWNADGGWVAASKALKSVGNELIALGVQGAFGPSGTFKEPLLSEDGENCIGVIAVDGTVWDADRVVLATGAWSPSLVDLQGQCISKCWVFAHIQLTPSETAALKDIPVLYHHILGFFIEPTPDNCLLKLCNEFPGYTRLVKHTKPFGSPSEQEISVPRNRAEHSEDTIPTEAVEDIKRLVARCLPALTGRELINQTMCWCTDTADGNWLFCESKWKGLFLATGDSGHSFNTLPVVGGQIVDLLEGKLSPERQKLWGWRPGHGDPNRTGRGGDAPKDLKEVPGWKH